MVAAASSRVAHCFHALLPGSAILHCCPQLPARGHEGLGRGFLLGVFGCCEQRVDLVDVQHHHDQESREPVASHVAVLAETEVGLDLLYNLSRTAYVGSERARTSVLRQQVRSVVSLQCIGKDQAPRPLRKVSRSWRSSLIFIVLHLPPVVAAAKLAAGAAANRHPAWMRCRRSERVEFRVLASLCSWRSRTVVTVVAVPILYRFSNEFRLFVMPLATCAVVQGTVLLGHGCYSCGHSVFPCSANNWCMFRAVLLSAGR